MNWGNDPDVALWIGGPKDGVLENIGKNQHYRVAEPDRLDVYSWSDPLAKQYFSVRYTEYTRARVPYDGKWYTVMADRSQSDLRDIEYRVMEEVYSRYTSGGWGSSGYHNNWSVSGGTAQQYATTQQLKQLAAYQIPVPEPKKSPEEALAWLHQTEGKDFL